MHRCADKLTDEQQALICLGGKAAVEMMNPGTIGEGCAWDLMRAARSIRQQMENSAALGFALIDVQSDNYNEMSQFLNHRGEIVVQTELERYMRRVWEILQQHRLFLEKITEELVQKETLLHSDIQRIKVSCEG